MASLNKVMLIGHVGRAPEIRRTQDGAPVVTLSIATSDSFRDRASGERRQLTEWHRVVIFNEGLCRVVEQYVKKGAKLYIEGKLKTRKWSDKDGIERHTTEIVLSAFESKLLMLDGAGGDDDGAQGPGADEGESYAQRTYPRNSQRPRDDLDDEIPF